MLTGGMIEAPEAERIGLVNHVIEPGELLGAAFATAEMISANSPFGMRVTKQVLQTNVDAPSLPAALELENRNQVLATPNPRHGRGPGGVHRETGGPFHQLLNARC
jgi:Enoyl-CoA hydratase/carnithine racemase